MTGLHGVLGSLALVVVLAAPARLCANPPPDAKWVPIPELTDEFRSETRPEWFGLPDKKDLPSTFSIEYVRSWRRVEVAEREKAVAGHDKAKEQRQ